MAAKLKTAVLGATGYSGLELTRILLRHPRTEKPVLLRRPSSDGVDNGASDLAAVFPVLSGNGGYPLQSLSWPALKQQGVQLLFLATPHEASRSLVPEAIAQGLRVIDLSGAWRLKQERNRAIYNFEDSDSTAADSLTQQAVYGLPELNGDCVAKATLVANPGLLCNIGDPGAGAATESRSGGSQSRDYLRLEIGSVRSGKRTDGQDALRFGGRQFLGVCGVQPSARGRDRRAIGAGHAGTDFHAAPASDSARHSVDDLCTSKSRDDAAGSGIVLQEFLRRQALGARLRDAKASAGAVFVEHELLRSRILPWRKTGGGWC